ncbi:c-type cytochrome [Paraburkholderia acidisoli]|uniref:C-type cytochrome n=1 Tax=Paraburkholderia acidisoli TaxID=2571748 RepID=A0A7Z2GKL7_9BURK|nr:c-type cytochrome [Paraburkholderia acidisoli]QGZ63154.1 c-type cytochrome [Paraburkholderia acidisoli]
MSDERLFSFRNVWFRASVGATVLTFVVSVLIGFVWLPSVQKDAQFQGIWNAICSAAGVPNRWHASETSVVPAYKISTVELAPHMLDGATNLSIGRGATLSLRCTMCHGPRGLSMANSPNLAGQYATAVYKELHDFQTGARQNAVMSPMARDLSDQDMRDLAAYYASIPPIARVRGNAPAIVAVGAPMRNIPACGACHGGVDSKVGSPWLDGLPAPYTAAQLEAFANGTRHNDISEQMRNIARNMTPEEIDAAAAWYAGQPAH